MFYHHSWLRDRGRKGTPNKSISSSERDPLHLLLIGMHCTKKISNIANLSTEILIIGNVFYEG